LSIWCRDIADQNSVQTEETLVQPNTSGLAEPLSSANQPNFAHMQGNTKRTHTMHWFNDGLIRGLNGSNHGSMGPQKQREQLNSPATHLRNASHTVQGSCQCNGGRRGPGWSSAELHVLRPNPLAPKQAQPPRTGSYQLQEAI
jgi:hypothetical protein